MIKILLNNKEYSYPNRVRVLDLLETKDYSIIACKVNNRIRELSFELHHDSEVEFLHLDNYEAVKIYEASLRYVFAMACSRIYPELDIKFNYHISRSIYCKNVKDDTPFTLQMVKNIEEEMNKIIHDDIPFVRTVVTNLEAGEIYAQYHLDDKVKILKYRPEKTVHLYKCDEYLNYMYSYMVPSTGYLTKFKLRLYGSGVIIQYPRAEFGGSIPPFENENTYGQTLKRASNFAKTCKCEKIADINEYVDSNKKVDFINMCEARHNRDLAILGEKIQDNIDSIRLIAIAGPSSSGKTTFSKKIFVIISFFGRIFLHFVTYKNR
jgi:uridine kinase